MVGDTMIKCVPANSVQLLKSAEDGYFAAWHCRHFFTCTGRFHSFARWSGKAVQTGNTYLSCSVRICKDSLRTEPDIITLNWNEEGRMSLWPNSFKNGSTVIWFTNHLLQWKWKDTRIEVWRERQGEPTRVSLYQYSEERKIVNSQKSLSRKRCEGHYSIRGNQVS